MLPRILQILMSIAVILLLTQTISCASVSVAERTPEMDLALIMDWWNGDYNNDRQIKSLEEQGLPVWKADDTGEGGHIEVTSHYRRVDLPVFGENVLYVEETKHGDPDNIFRQRIYTLNIDQEANAVRVKLWYFNDKKKYIGAWKDLTLLNDLTPEDMFPLQDDCDLISTRQAEKIHLPMPAKDCVFGEKYFNYQVLLDENSFWFRDRIMLVADDSLDSTAGQFTYHELDKVSK